MRKSKIGSLFLISVFVLAGIGVSYAGFFDDISVYGAVDTATVTLTLEATSGTWVYKIWGWTTTPQDPVFPGYETTWIPAQEVLIVRGFTYFPEVYVTDWAALYGAQYELISWARGLPGPNVESDYDVDLKWWNIFPCIDFIADFIFHYDGSIPAHITITDYSYTGYNFAPYTTWKYYYYTYDNGVWTRGDEITSFPVQVHNCQYIGVYTTIHLPQLEDNSLQGLHGEFSFNVHALQWNDLCPTPP